MRRSASPSRPSPALVLAVLALGFSAGLARAQCTQTTVCIPDQSCEYDGSRPISYPPGPCMIRNVRLSSPTSCAAPAPPGGTISSFFDVFVDLQLSTDGGATWVPEHTTAHSGIQSTTETNGTTFDTQMLQLDISGGTFPAGTMIRQSPSNTSVGQETETTGSGGFHVSSFFDIFTEVSLDGGSTWTPASAGDQVTLSVPGATLTVHETWGALKVIYR